jgi:hypothetical protein
MEISVETVDGNTSIEEHGDEEMRNEDNKFDQKVSRRSVIWMENNKDRMQDCAPWRGDNGRGKTDARQEKSAPKKEKMSTVRA